MWDDDDDEDLPPFESVVAQPTQARPQRRSTGGDAPVGPKVRSRGAQRRASGNFTERGPSRAVPSDSKDGNLAKSPVEGRVTVKVEGLDNRTGTAPKSTTRAKVRAAGQVRSLVCFTRVGYRVFRATCFESIVMPVRE